MIRYGNFEVGDFFLLKLRPTLKTTLHSPVLPKVDARYFGPFRIESKVGL